MKLRIGLFAVILICSTSKVVRAQSWGDASKANKPVFVSAETGPGFPGGLKGYYQFLADSLKTPSNAFSTFSTRLVTTRIIIDTVGTIVFAEIEKGVNEDYNQEALRLIKIMPAWTPAKQNGHAVSFTMSIPILFME